MEERNILSREEVEAIIKSAQSAGALDDPDAGQDSNSSNINSNALNNIIEQTSDYIENKLTILLRKKMVVKNKPAILMKSDEFAKLVSENHVFSSFKLNPYSSPALVSIENRFLDVMLNLLYGGTVEAASEQGVKVGKVGVVTSEKISQMVMDGFVAACKEYGEMTAEPYKTSSALLSANNIHEEESVYSFELQVLIEELELTIRVNLTDELLIKMIPLKTGSGKHKEKDFWRSAIKSEVMDSYVTVTTNMADFKVTLKDFMNMKEGDELEIGDPTLVYVCLNDLKLYRALAGQSNSKLVVKIVSQV